jgi:hypothetical protein
MVFCASAHKDGHLVEALRLRVINILGNLLF